jgi:5-oxoprolinase (ATP-hydrolysing)
MSTSTTNRWAVGFDIGGTFTDYVLLNLDDGRMHVHKQLTTPDDPARGALEGIRVLLEQRNLTFADVFLTIHGTTLVTNTLIERRGAVTGMLTTEGFRDILEMGKEQRYDIYDLFLKFPTPLVRRRFRREVPERVDRSGAVVLPLDEAAVLREAEFLVAEGVESLAIVFLHAYAFPQHEQRAAAIVRERFPQIPVVTSAEVAAEIREYERSVTTAANAYVKPPSDRYIARLEEALRAAGMRGQFLLMQSSGGTTLPSTARALPIRLLESGPAAGGLAAAYFGGLMGWGSLLSFDMGGTTAKACVIEGGVPTVVPEIEVAREHRFTKGSGLPVRTPSVDLIEIGAGGGSIARVDAMGLLKVGPHSAGAAPGPACYGRGGTEATVTDANLVLGYLDPGFFLGGEMSLDRGAAERAIDALAAPLGLTRTEAAWGIHQLVTENMASAARIHMVEKGRDPRSLAMAAFGGAGPAHACRIARVLGMRHVAIPVAAGATSAFGFLAAPLAFDFSHSYPTILGETDWDHLNALLSEMEARGRGLITPAGIAPEAMTVQRVADMRLLGQVHSIEVPIPLGPLGPESIPAIEEAFEATYRRLYRHWFEGYEMLAMTWRVTVRGPAPVISLRRASTSPVAGAQKGTRSAYFPEANGFVETPVFNRYALTPGTRIAGPCIVEERESTLVVPPGDVLGVDEHGNLRIDISVNPSHPERALHA